MCNRHSLSAGFHAAQPPLLAWPALLSLSKHPDSARRSVPALWLAGTVPLAYSQSNLGYDQGTSKPSADLAAQAKLVPSYFVRALKQFIQTEPFFNQLLRVSTDQIH